MGVSNELRDAIMKHMPNDAECYVTETDSGGAVLSIHWKLNNDPNRPNKYSKTIIIRLTRERLEDFPNYPPSMQEVAMRKLEDWVPAQLRLFNPDHDTPRYQQPPSVEWAIGSGDLFA